MILPELSEICDYLGFGSDGPGEVSLGVIGLPVLGKRINNAAK
jgi:hypothetical protein